MKNRKNQNRTIKELNDSSSHGINTLEPLQDNNKHQPKRKGINTLYNFNVSMETTTK